MVLSLHLGVRQNSPAEVWAALFGGGDDTASLVIATLRVPRTLIAPVVGAGLGLAGLLLQSVSRNPLASPDLLGINAGAALAVVIAVAVFDVAGLLPLAAIAALGALGTTALVFALALAAGGAMSSVNTLLAGVTLAGFFAAGTQIVLVVDETAMETLIFWLSGGFVDRSLSLLWLAAPVTALAFLIALINARALDVLAADDQSAAALGVPVGALRALMLGLAALLAAAAVTTAGPVSFVGLVAPHIARRLAGAGHAVLVPLSAIIGAALAIYADIAARFVIHPSEAPVGAVLAFVGVPVLVILLQAGTLRQVRA
ncbi:iron complex transport system permease protein [Devosia enhydra]|uniref:Iron complex transport system permease protein n=2 Tax=Devosia enhydra TaxID=665118 RepID=A0A1K2I0F7_9HYPH|nr:iron complex transport system permease protein [Devosia enhydra]